MTWPLATDIIGHVHVKLPRSSTWCKTPCCHHNQNQDSTDFSMAAALTSLEACKEPNFKPTVALLKVDPLDHEASTFENAPSRSAWL